ncbi:MAG TPA: lytic transglycosylase domain-containing protein [Chloroflexota bacterium]|nr:lytic transglycosylase domain-containing protein [Chloroflexota bacterium]
MSAGLLAALVSLLVSAAIAAFTAMAALRPLAPEPEPAGVEAPAPAAPRLTERGGRWVPASNPAPTTSVFARPAPRPPAPAATAAAAVAPASLAVAPASLAVAAARVADHVPPAPPSAGEPRLGQGVPAAIRRWEPLILRYAKRHGLDPHLLAALMQTESGGDPNARSSAGAVGLLQLLDGPTDPEENIAAGAALFARHLRTFGDLDLALAAYNAGPAAVRIHGGVPPYDETRWHVYLTRYWYWAFASG